ncbi:hypothetical protein [Pseudomonas aeruginosa]|uniref:type IVB secretion system protein IcmW n=1 Tax=Pseudomonas aeruginosa TaxID=287 RepID=UPI001EBF2785|nr:hypothetical protein [Pseudomonas aeruginosa]EMA2592525.1 hypothetical protein [Pseudomonas aeruginosa]MBX6882389.1 hypothetical protein [Pseudomonas aeruginosa]MBX6932661.1 hypothetical protein [Pseudomonas aeruginosa]MCZ9867194.1 hypothetical protein [Pseudomonas aeruginosa]MCZ9906404.1 hypothetical protein [Pseudomonas aeruginosa]
MSSARRIDLTPGSVQAFWKEREPKLLSFFEQMDNKEHWALRDIDAEFSALYAEVAHLLQVYEQSRGLEEPLVAEAVSQLTAAAAALPCSASSRFFEWVGEQSLELPYILLEHAHQNSKLDPNCSVIWQRARMIARYQILKDIVAEITGNGGIPA